MKRRAGIVVLLLSFALLIYLTCFRGNPVRLSECMISGEQISQLTQNRQKSEEQLMDGLSFDGEALFFDIENDTFYYSLVEGNSSAYDPYVIQKSEYDSVSVAFFGETITEETIKNNQSIKMIAYDDSYYREYELKCTTLPMMNITCEEEIATEVVAMSMTLFDNRQGATQKMTFSDGMIRTRGASTRNYPKKSFRLSLLQESLGANNRNNKISLLGMRQDEDWILYPAYNDSEKIRNVFSSNLWKYTCAKDNSFGIDNGMEFKYIELFMNGEYWGLYALGYPIDELQLEIDMDGEEGLYKKVSWENEQTITLEEDSYIPGYNTEESEADEWQILRQYYESLHVNWQDTELMYAGIDLDNAIDAYLFFNLIQGMDNVAGGGSQTIKNMYLSFKQVGEQKVLLYTPWDMDTTWGKLDTGVTSNTYSVSAAYNTIMEHGNIHALMLNGDEKIWDMIFSKYWELRENLWSEDNINAMLNEYEADIFGSGAYRRDMERWPEGTYVSADEGLFTFRRFVLERLQEADDYYPRLEELKTESIYITRSAQYKDFQKAKFIIEVNDKELLQDKDHRDLLEYIGVDISAITEQVRYVLVNGKSQEVEYLEQLAYPEGTVDTCIGKVERTEGHILCVDGEEWYTTTVSPKKDMQMWFTTQDGVTPFEFTKEFILWSYYEKEQNPKWGERIRNGGYSAFIEILNHDVLQEEKFAELVNIFGVDADNLPTDTDFVVIQNGGEAVNILNNSHSSGSRGNTVLGELSIFYAEDGAYGIYLDGEECIIVNPEENENIDIRIVVLDPTLSDGQWSKTFSYLQ